MATKNGGSSLLSIWDGPMWPPAGWLMGWLGKHLLYTIYILIFLYTIPEYYYIIIDLFTISGSITNILI